jgi:Mn-dependent DtxR family transcriptional regulator
MSNEVWKHFAEHEVSHSMAHYLTTIHELHARQGYARVSDVAKELDVTKGSASVQVKHLKEKGFVAEDDNRHLQLTEPGDEVARQVIYTRSVLIRLFSEYLGVDPEVAESDACKIEHLLSSSTGHQLLTLVRLLESSDPAAKAFLARFRGFRPDCERVEDCGICEDRCLLEGASES